MATREENIKKINVELKKLSDEELDQITGGTIGETAGDSEILYDHGLMNKWYGTIHVTFRWLSKSAEVDAARAKAGITCCTAPISGNRYWLGGKKITRKEAFDHVKANFERIHHVSDELFE